MQRHRHTQEQAVRKLAQGEQSPAVRAGENDLPRGLSPEVGVAVLGLVDLDFLDDVDVDDAVNVAPSGG